MQQGDERAAAGEPDRRLAGGVAAADDGDARGSAELRLRRAGGVEDADPLVVGEVGDGQAAVLRAGREQHGPRADLLSVLEPDEMPAVPGLERDRAIRSGGARVELARLG